MLHSPRSPVADALVLGPDIRLARTRAHEATGPARHVFAMMLARAVEGPVLWLHPSWQGERLLGDGICDWLEPGRLVIGRGQAAEDLLWAAEEGLRTGILPLVVVDESGATPLRSGGALCDIGPTVLAMLGVEAPAEMTGKDLRPTGVLA